MSKQLNRSPIHLGLGATSVPETEIAGLQWYDDYLKKYEQDGIEGRLVSMETFDTSWENWEMHPQGTEVVICTVGEMTLIQEINGKKVRSPLKAGEYAINPPGVWHTADVNQTATAIFITSGRGTVSKGRE